MSTKILVVDDDVNICEAIKLYLVNEGYDVKTANDGDEGITTFKTFEPDLVLLDIMMPKKDGKQTCREIREISNKPIIMVTAKDEVFDKVLLLELGADDYLVKPFDMKELSVRIKAVLRRYQSIDNKADSESVSFDNIEISLSKYELKIKGKVEEIPPKELQLLYFLASNYNRVFTRDQLLDKVWGFDYLGDSRTVDVHVKRLREKLEGVSDKWALKTVWGVGYKQRKKQHIHKIYVGVSDDNLRQFHNTDRDNLFNDGAGGKRTEKRNRATERCASENICRRYLGKFIPARIV